MAGDIARELGDEKVTDEQVVKDKKIAKPLEQKIADRYVERRKDYKTYSVKGSEIGMVNGLAVMGGDLGMSEMAGILMPIVAEITPAQSKDHGRVVATGKLGEIAKEAVETVSALIKKYTGEDITNYDIQIPENAVFRINLAWVNSINELKKLLELHKAHDIFLDLPINRTKPPNNRYSLEGIISILQDHNNVKYIAV